MHETAVAMSLLEQIVGAAPAETVERVVAARLRIGELTCLDPDTLGFAFEVVSRGTVAEGCELRFDHQAARVSCPECGWTGAWDAAHPGCGGCGARSVELTAGRELHLVAIDVEEYDHA